MSLRNVSRKPSKMWSFRLSHFVRRPAFDFVMLSQPSVQIMGERCKVELSCFCLWSPRKTQHVVPELSTFVSKIRFPLAIGYIIRNPENQLAASVIEWMPCCQPQAPFLVQNRATTSSLAHAQCSGSQRHYALWLGETPGKRPLGFPEVRCPPSRLLRTRLLHGGRIQQQVVAGWGQVHSCTIP